MSQRDLRVTVNQAAAVAGTVISKLSTAFAETYWVGPGADEARRMWNESVMDALAQSALSLTEIAEDLRNQS